MLEWEDIAKELARQQIPDEGDIELFAKWYIASVYLDDLSRYSLVGVTPSKVDADYVSDAIVVLFAFRAGFRAGRGLPPVPISHDAQKRHC